MQNLNLPLSWFLTDEAQARYNILILGKKWNWIYSAQIPDLYIFQNINDKIYQFPDKKNNVIRGCNNYFRKYLSAYNYKSVRIGQEAVLDLNSDHFNKKSLRYLIRRGNRHGKISQKEINPGNTSNLDELRIHSAHGKKPQLSYLFNTGLNNDMQLFVFEQPDGVWRAALTVTRQSSQKCQLEIFLRRNHAPVGTMESLIYNTAKILKHDGYRYFSLGEVPFINSIGRTRLFSKDFVVKTIGKIFSFAYNYQGLYQFKNKFVPQWYDVYLCAQYSVSLRLFYALFCRTGFIQLVKYSIINKIKYLF